MSQKTKHVWPTLLEAGLAEDAEPKTDKLESPWYVKVLLAFSGWLAALFLLSFIGTVFFAVIENSAASFIVGGIMIGVTYRLLRMPKNEFYEHLSLALSLTGQMLVTRAIFDFSGDLSATFWLLTALLQALLAIVIPNFTHRVFSAFIAAFSFAIALAIMGTPHVFSSIIMFIVSWLWLNEFRYPQHLRKTQAIGYGLVLALISLTGTVLYGYNITEWQLTSSQPEPWVQAWMSEALIGVVMLYVIWQLLQRHHQTISAQLTAGILLAALLLCAASMEAPGITVGITILLLGFAGSNRTLLGLGIVSLLFYISSYYYFLDVTLLAKAQTLFLIGLTLLATHGLMLRIKPKNRETENA